MVMKLTNKQIGNDLEACITSSNWVNLGFCVNICCEDYSSSDHLNMGYVGQNFRLKFVHHLILTLPLY